MNQRGSIIGVLEEKKADPSSTQMSTVKETEDPPVQMALVQQARRPSESTINDDELERELERQRQQREDAAKDSDKPPMSTTSFTLQGDENEPQVVKRGNAESGQVTAELVKPNPSQPLSSQLVMTESEVHHVVHTTEQEKPRISLAKATPVVTSPPQSSTLAVSEKPPSGLKPASSGNADSSAWIASSDATGVDRTVYKAEEVELRKERDRAKVAALATLDMPPASGLSEQVDPLGGYGASKAVYVPQARKKLNDEELLLWARRKLRGEDNVPDLMDFSKDWKDGFALMCIIYVLGGRRVSFLVSQLVVMKATDLCV